MLVGRRLLFSAFRPRFSMLMPPVRIIFTTTAKTLTMLSRAMPPLAPALHSKQVVAEFVEQLSKVPTIENSDHRLQMIIKLIEQDEFFIKDGIVGAAPKKTAPIQLQLNYAENLSNILDAMHVYCKKIDIVSEEYENNPVVQVYHELHQLHQNLTKQLLLQQHRLAELFVSEYKTLSRDVLQNKQKTFSNELYKKYILDYTLYTHDLSLSFPIIIDNIKKFALAHVLNPSNSVIWIQNMKCNLATIKKAKEQGQLVALYSTKEKLLSQLVPLADWVIVFEYSYASSNLAEKRTAFESLLPFGLDMVLYSPDEENVLSFLDQSSCLMDMRMT